MDNYTDWKWCKENEKQSPRGLHALHGTKFFFAKPYAKAKLQGLL